MERPKSDPSLQKKVNAMRAAWQTRVQAQKVLNKQAMEKLRSKFK